MGNNVFAGRQAPPCFTKEQTAALKQFIGMDEFYPSMWEVKQAGKIFKAKLATIAQTWQTEKPAQTVPLILPLPLYGAKQDGIRAINKTNRQWQRKTNQVSLKSCCASCRQRKRGRNG